MTELENIRASFDPKHLIRLMPFKAKQDIRYYLKGILIEKAERGGVYLVATDGHTLAIIHDATGTIEGAEKVIVAVEPVLVTGAKTSQRGSNLAIPYRVVLERQRMKVAASMELELALQPGRCIIEGTYPDWKKILPADFSKLKRGAFENAFNAHYLARFSKLVEPRFPGMEFWQEAPEKALIVRLPRFPEMLALIMPMRADGGAVNFAPFTFAKPPAAAPLPEQQPSDAEPVTA